MRKEAAVPLSEGAAWGGTKNSPISFPSPRLLDQHTQVRKLTMLMGKEAFEDHKVVHL